MKKSKNNEKCTLCTITIIVAKNESLKCTICTISIIIVIKNSLECRIIAINITVTIKKSSGCTMCTVIIIVAIRSMHADIVTKIHLVNICGHLNWYGNDACTIIIDSY